MKKLMRHLSLCSLTLILPGLSFAGAPLIPHQDNKVPCVTCHTPVAPGKMKVPDSHLKEGKIDEMRANNCAMCHQYKASKKP